MNTGVKTSSLELNLLQDKLLTALLPHVPFSLFEVDQAYKRLWSFDKLLSCIAKAKQEGRSLESFVDVMAGNEEGKSYLLLIFE